MEARKFGLSIAAAAAIATPFEAQMAQGAVSVEGNVPADTTPTQDDTDMQAYCKGLVTEDSVHMTVNGRGTKATVDGSISAENNAGNIDADCNTPFYNAVRPDARFRVVNKDGRVLSGWLHLTGELSTDDTTEFKNGVDLNLNKCKKGQKSETYGIAQELDVTQNGQTSKVSRVSKFVTKKCAR